MPAILNPRGKAAPPPVPRYGQADRQRAKGGQSKPTLIIRGQSGEEPAPKPPVKGPAPAVTLAKVDIPTPEEIGLLGAATPGKPVSSLDWPTARTRLDQLGATFYRLEKAPEGGFRFVCALP